MNFLLLTDGSYLALSEVVRHRSTRNGVHIEVRDGRSYETTQDNWDRAFGTAFAAVIPAEPGTVYLTPVTQEDGSTSWDHDAVLAWGVRRDGYVTAIGADGADDMDRAVLMPSGKVTAGLGGDWPSEAAYLEFRREQDALAAATGTS